MTTLDERIAELIQADVDGELAADDQTELTAALEASAQARDFHAEMTRMTALLRETPQLDPPWGLRRRILDSIELPARQWLGDIFKPASYGLAVAAGVLIAVGVAQVTPRGADDMSSLVGTMVSKGQELPHAATSELSIDLAALSGQVRLKSLKQAWAVEFDLKSQEAVEIAVDLDGTGLVFGGYADQDENAGIEDFEVSGQNVRMTNQGSHQFVLFLRRVPEGNEGSQEIGIAVNHLGTTIFTGLLQSRG